jgi:hypothetical protein
MATQEEVTQYTPTDADIQSIYRDTFGRDADTAGLNYWKEDVARHNRSADDLRNAIHAGATGYDVVARDDPTGPEYATAWDSSLDPNSGNLVYDANRDSWVPEKQKKPEPVQPEPVQPSLYSVKPDTMTVQGQMQGLLASDSPYINLARQQAAEQANSRGLLNSSIAASAGQRAAIGSALPIAQQDAQTYFSQSNLNQNAENNFKLFNKEFEYNDYFADQEYLQQQGLNAQQNYAAMDLQRLQDSGSMDRLETELEYKRDIAEMENAINWEQIDAENRQMFTEATGKLGQQYIDAVKDIQISRDLDADSKDVAIANLKALYRENMQFQADLYDVELVWGDIVAEQPAEDASTEGTTTEQTYNMPAAADVQPLGAEGYTLLEDGRYMKENSGGGYSVFSGDPTELYGDVYFDQGNGFYVDPSTGGLVTKRDIQNAQAPMNLQDGEGG